MKRLILASLLSLSFIIPVQAGAEATERSRRATSEAYTHNGIVDECAAQMFAELDANPDLRVKLGQKSHKELEGIVADAFDACISEAYYYLFGY